ncbi:MAG: hypothetical protein ABIQ06_13630, partial [Caldimonas sp.]
ADGPNRNVPWERLEYAHRSPGAVDIGSKVLRLADTPQKPPPDGTVETDGIALVVVDPTRAGSEHGASPHVESANIRAAIEAHADFEVVVLEQPDETGIERAVDGRRVRMVHCISRQEPRRGQYPGEDLFWITRLPNAPELVVLETDSSWERSNKDNIRVMLQRSGTSIVLTTRGRTNDNASRVFFNQFYTGILKGHTLFDAIVSARQETRSSFPSDDTWSRYQAWGDPSAVIRDVRSRPKAREVPFAAEQLVRLTSALPDPDAKTQRHITMTLSSAQFAHKGLERIYQGLSSAAIPASLAGRCQRLLNCIESATKPDDPNIPGNGYKKTGAVHSLDVNAVKRIDYEWRNGKAADIDYV